ncbi:alanine racemase [candidate division NPL-UPA2 bacterium]|nr:alanine racemase [candidate division NPL-UPA2 bacterium]
MIETPGLTWSEINLAAIAHNLKEIRRRVGSAVKILCAVKADGYGHGAVAVSKTVFKEGADYLGVANLREAIQLREAGLKADILIFGCGLPEEADDIVRYNLTATVCTEEFAGALSKKAEQEKRKTRVHINVDTGMGRIGVYFEEAAEFTRKVAELKYLDIEGIYTHFPSAEEKDKTFSLLQIQHFKETIAQLERQGINIPLKHMANSAAILNLPESHFNLVRPGLILYGIYPSDEASRSLELKPALTLKTRIVFLKKVPAGRTISYGRTYTTERGTTIATLPIGYADGYSRRLSNPPAEELGRRAGRAEVLIDGKRAPVVGRICMDQIMVDVGHIPQAKIGQEVVLIGRHAPSDGKHLMGQGEDRISVEEIAGKMGTIPHEVVSRLGKRIYRVSQ